MIQHNTYPAAVVSTEDIEPKTDAMKQWQRFVKRGADIVLSAIGLIILSPVFLLIYILLKLAGENDVIYAQERIGYRGEPFTIYKFKTFCDDAEIGGPVLCQIDDERLTPLGRILRVHHLDELPQLWNVLTGDMSMVGPRPERKYFIDQIMRYDCRYAYLYQLRPGVTSDATLYNGYTDTMEKMLKRLDRDLYYLENRTLTMDFVIIIKTALSIVSGKKF